MMRLLVLLAALLVCPSQASSCTERRLRGLRHFFNRTSSSRDLLHGVWRGVATYDKCGNIADLINERQGEVSDLKRGLARSNLRLQEEIWKTWANNGTTLQSRPSSSRLKQLEINMLSLMGHGLEELQDLIGSHPMVPQLRSLVMELFHTMEQWSPGETKSALSSLICSLDLSPPHSLDGWTPKHIQELQMLFDTKISLLDLQIVPERLNATFIRLKKILLDKDVVQAVSNKITASYEKMMTGKLPKFENFLSRLLNYLSSEKFWSEQVNTLEDACRWRDEAMDSWLKNELSHLGSNRGAAAVLSDYDQSLDLTSGLARLLDRVLHPLDWVLDGLEFGVNGRYPGQVNLGLSHLWGDEEFLLRDQLELDSLGDAADNNTILGIGVLYLVGHYVGFF